MNTLFIHIGSWKTATSAIQRMMTINRALMQKCGVDFFAFSFDRDASKELSSGNGSHFARLYYPENHRAYLADEKHYLSALNETVASSGCPKGLLSSELFFGQSQPQRLFDGLKQGLGSDVEFKVICYLRCQDQMVERRYIESVKLGLEARKFDELKQRYIDSPENNYYDILKPWVDAFGRDNVIVRPYEKTQFKEGSILVDFMDALGLDMPQGVESPGRLNKSVDAKGVEVIRILKKLNLSPTEHAFIMRQVSDYLTMREGSREPVLLTHDERRMVLEQYREQNKLVARRIIGRQDGRLFLEEPNDTPPEQSTLDTAYLTELILYLLVRVYRNMR